MAAENITIARPYAEAVFARARESGRLAEWQAALERLAAIVAVPEARDFLLNPAVSAEQKTALVLEVGGEALDGEPANLVRLLVEKGRLLLAPEIARLYQALRNEQEGRLEAEVYSALPLDEALQQRLAELLKNKFGREVVLETHEDPALIGGVLIRAGDLVIDASVAGQLGRLANELGIQG